MSKFGEPSGALVNLRERLAKALAEAESARVDQVIAARATQLVRAGRG